ncbi:MAG: hypothetical protein SGI92_22940 [Bryobacteraceae bacterium]|nr:hypothetical protein [Bryobacteraceae bacterium]
MMAALMNPPPAAPPPDPQQTRAKWQRIYDDCLKSQMTNIDALKKDHDDKVALSIWTAAAGGIQTGASRTPGGVLERVAGAMVIASVYMAGASIAAAIENKRYENDEYRPAIRRAEVDCSRIADASVKP